MFTRYCGRHACTADGGDGGCPAADRGPGWVCARSLGGTAFRDGRGPRKCGPSTAPPQSGPPAIDKPKVDLSWQDCTREVLANANITTSPAFTLECAEYKAPLDPINGAPGSVTLGAVRAKTSQTPADAGPSSSPRAPICRPRSNWRHGSTARARRFSSSVRGRGRPPRYRAIRCHHVPRHLGYAGHA